MSGPVMSLQSLAKRNAALREAFRRAARCGSVSPSGFRCDKSTGHRGEHVAAAGGALRRWAPYAEIDL